MFDSKPIETKGQVLDSLVPIGDAIQWLLTLGQIKCFYERLIDFIGLEEQDKVLDVGCGSGKLAIILQAKVKDKGYVVGINPGPKGLTKAQRRTEKEGIYPDFRLGVIENLPFKNNYFDKVFATLMLHHLPRDLREQGLKEVLRVLKAGGVLGVMDHGPPINYLAKFLFYPFLANDKLEYTKDFYYGRFPSMLKEVGFKQISYQTIWGGLLYLYRAVKEV